MGKSPGKLVDIDLLLSFFLSGLRWHLPGLPELPLEQRLHLLLAGKSFFHFYNLFYKKSLLPVFLFFVRLVLYVRRILRSIRACCRRPSSDIYYRTTSTGQHIQPTQAAKTVRDNQSATTQASR